MFRQSVMDSRQKKWRKNFMAPETPSPPLGVNGKSQPFPYWSQSIGTKQKEQTGHHIIARWVFVCHPTWVFTASQRRSFHLLLSGYSNLFFQIKYHQQIGPLFCEYQSWPGVLGSLAVLLSGGAYFYREFSLHRRNCINKREVLLFLSSMSWLKYLICYLEDLFALSLRK